MPEPLFKFEFVRVGPMRKTILKFDPEDLIALGGVLVAIIMTVAMVLGWVPINTYTASIVGISTCGAAITKIINARHKHSKGSVWLVPALIIIVILIVASFGVYVWVTWR